MAVRSALDAEADGSNPSSASIREAQNKRTMIWLQGHDVCTMCDNRAYLWVGPSTRHGFRSRDWIEGYDGERAIPFCGPHCSDRYFNPAGEALIYMGS